MPLDHQSSSSLKEAGLALKPSSALILVMNGPHRHWQSAENHFLNLQIMLICSLNKWSVQFCTTLGGWHLMAWHHQRLKSMKSMMSILYQGVGEGSAGSQLARASALSDGYYVIFIAANNTMRSSSGDGNKYINGRRKTYWVRERAHRNIKIGDEKRG